MLLAGPARADYRGLVVRAPLPSVASPAPAPPPVPRVATPVSEAPTKLASRPSGGQLPGQYTDSTALSGDDAAGLDFDAVDEPDDPEDVEAEPDAEGDFDADA